VRQLPAALALLGLIGLTVLVGLLAGAPDLKAADNEEAASMIDPSLFVAAGHDLVTIEHEAIVDAPPAAVFAALTTPEGFRDVLKLDGRVELRIGGPLEFFFQADSPAGQRGSEGCQILSYVPDRLLSFSWSAPPLFPRERERRTWVVMTFDELKSGRTHVRLTHLGFGQGGRWDDVREYFVNAWPKFLSGLAAGLRQPDD
jgi:uncharacterized protein YndB with AHSA1/START domain